MNIPDFFNDALAVVARPLDQLVLEPIKGLLEVGIGLTLAVPEVASAAVQATLIAIKDNLDLKARFKVLAGTTLIADGLHRLRWYLLAGGIAAAIIGGASGILLVVSITSGTVIGLWALAEIGDPAELLQQFAKPRAYEPAAA